MWFLRIFFFKQKKGPASLWLGLSIYSLSKLAFWFLCEVTNRKKRRKFDEEKQEDKIVENKNFKTDYQTNYKPFILDNNNNVITDSKQITKSIDNYYNQLNRESKFNSPVSLSPANKRYNSSFGQFTPMIYKAGLEMYPKKPLKIRKANEEENANTDKTTDETADGKIPEPTEKNLEETDLDKLSNESGWMTKLVRQKNKLMNLGSLFSRNAKVNPN